MIPRRPLATLAALFSLAALLISGAPSDATPVDIRRVIVVVVDGLEPHSVGAVLTPTLDDLVEGSEARAYDGRANMITETNANHTAMVTGAYGETSGLVANGFFDTRAGADTPMDRPSLILSETLFDVLAGRDDLTSASVMGKAKLRNLFDCTRTSSGGCGPSADNPEGIEVIHARPDHHAGAAELGGDFDPDAHDHAPAEPASGSGYALDDHVMDIVIDLHSGDDPSFTFVNLGGVDGLQHLFGARSPEGRAAVLNADRNIGRLVAHLREVGAWEETALIVTADHSFEDTGDPLGTDTIGGNPAGPDVHHANPLTPQATGHVIPLDELLGECSNGTPFAATSHGGSASVHLTGYDAYDPNDAPTTEQEACLSELRARALGRDGVDEALYRIDVEDDPATLIANVHPDWKLDTPRAGELLLTTENGYAFISSRASSDSVVSGTHGGPAARPVPFIVASGSSTLLVGEADAVARPVDIAPTVARLLGVDEPADNEGTALLDAFSG